MKKEFLPTITAKIVISNRKTVFHMDDKKVIVETPGELMQRLITLCNGKQSICRVVESLKSEWDESLVRGLIKELRNHHVLVDGRWISDESWKLVESPIGFPPFLSDKEKARLVETHHYSALSLR